MNSQQQLPRGRHGIPPEEVIANQRQRLVGAAAAVIAERGCCAISVNDIVERAGVSRRTFYELFENKSDCLLATQQHSFDCLHERITAACSTDREWPERVGQAVWAAIEFAATNLDEARLALAPSYAHLEPGLTHNGLAFENRLAAMLERSARDRPNARSVDRLAAQGALGAAISIGGAHLAAGEIDALRTRQAELTQILVAPYLDSGEDRPGVLAA